VSNLVGSAVAAYRTSPGTYPAYGFTTFDYYGNQHWAPFGREGTACGPAAVATVARWKRGRNLGNLELERLVNNRGPLGSDYIGIERMLLDMGVNFRSDWVRGPRNYTDAIRDKIKSGKPCIVLVDWGSQTPLDFSSWGAHYMVAYGATDDQILFTNIARVTSGQSRNFGYSNDRLRGLFASAMGANLIGAAALEAAGFWGLAVGYRLLSVTR